jgi:hypothetical protein
MRPTADKEKSANFALTEFSEVPQSPNFVRWSIYISLIQEYAPVVTWPVDAA